jgi:hypothetical protein
MTKFLIKWQMNLSMIPEDPVKRSKLWISMLELIKSNLKSGDMIDWGEYCDLSGGYTIAEGTEADILGELVKWTPHVLFDVKPVLDVDQVMEILNKSIAASKTK